MNRRGFVKFLSIMFPAAALVGCGGSDEPAAGAPEGDGDSSDDGGTGGNTTQACTGDAVVTYTNPGHGHVTTALTKAEIDAAAVGFYKLMDEADSGNSHPHTFELVAQDFVDLQAGQTVTKVDQEGHNHSITITC